MGGEGGRGEGCGERPHDQCGVLGEIGGAGRGRGMFREKEEAWMGGGNGVDAGDRHENIVGQGPPRHIGAIGRVAIDEIGRNDSSPQDLAGAVDVGKKRVERGDALDQPFFEGRPFSAG